MKPIHQRGAADMWSLFWTLIFFCSLYWLVYDFQDAPAEDVVELVSIVSDTPVAKFKVEAFLQETPYPKRYELKRLKKDINASIVTRTVESVTGVKPTVTAPKNTKAAETISSMLDIWPLTLCAAIITFWIFNMPAVKTIVHSLAGLPRDRKKV